MRFHQLSQMVGGWMVGDFEPSCIRTTACEVSCRAYKAGDSEPRHVHRVATELTLVASGRVAMNGKVLSAGEIIVLDPGDDTDFVALEDSTTVIVKMPSVIGDKYLVEAPQPELAGARP